MNDRRVDVRAWADDGEYADGLANVEERGDTPVSLKVELALFSLCDAPMEINRNSIKPASLDQSLEPAHTRHSRRTFIFSNTSRQSGIDGRRHG